MRRLCYGQMKQVLQSYYIPRIGGFDTKWETFYGLQEEKTPAICYLC